MRVRALFLTYRHYDLLVLVRNVVKKFSNYLGLGDGFPERGQVLDHAAQAH
jgi:hypothetical protein